MTDVVVGRASSFADPGRKVIEVGGVEIGVFLLRGEFRAYENVCPHMAGPVCQGKVIPRVEEVIAADRKSEGMAFSKTQTHIICPWHGYEYDIKTGEHPGNRRLKLKSVPVRVQDDSVIVTVPAAR
ncbi:MAG: Rieske (2Fe-2S) protein [Rhizobiales bacterium]|jgi:nitrite reductase/ring-hydroxylating ferredoxin subunit|nr:Rieske (2Fe-2S) protein [Hyphomicrobiales bacterium]